PGGGDDPEERERLSGVAANLSAIGCRVNCGCRQWVGAGGDGIVGDDLGGKGGRQKRAEQVADVDGSADRAACDGVEVIPREDAVAYWLVERPILGREGGRDGGAPCLVVEGNVEMDAGACHKVVTHGQLAVG